MNTRSCDDIKFANVRKASGNITWFKISHIIIIYNLSHNIKPCIS